MSDEIIIQRHPRTWLDDSVLRPFVSRYGQHLQHGAVCHPHPACLRVLRCAFRPLAYRETVHAERDRRIRRRPLPIEHIPACDCPYPVRRLRHELRAALARLLEVLSADGVGALDPALATAITQELARFEAHMSDVWGLAHNTRLRRTRVVHEFLLAEFSDQPITMSKVSAAAVRRFVLGEPGRSAGSIGVSGGAIGCYLRFRSMSGNRVSALPAAIPGQPPLAIGVPAGGSHRR